MTRHIALFAALAITVSCGGSVDPSNELAAQNASRLAPASDNSALTVYQGKCQYVAPGVLSGTCIADVFMECYWDHNNVNCLQQTASGSHTRLQDCGGVSVDTQRFCRITRP